MENRLHFRTSARPPDLLHDRSRVSPVPVFLQKPLSVVRMKPFEGIPEHDPGHSGVMPLEKQDQTGQVHLSGLPEHPPAGLVDQVLPVREQPFDQPESGINMPLADEPPGRDDGDPAIPLVLRPGEVEQDRRVLFPEIFSGNIGGALVHQVPFGHLLTVGDIKMKNLILPAGVPPVELVSQDAEPERPDLVDRG
jgi:hypothetical protein